jgi:uncharacterized glyoxalase superfamily protein PhnB
MSETMEMPVVETKGGLVAYLNVDGAVAAAEFYGKAFGAETAFIIPPDDKGRTMHAHVYINGSSVMLSDFYPEHGHNKVEPQGFNLTLMVDDAQAWQDRAAAAGCEITTPVQKMFWGDIWGEVRDPYGVQWAFNQPAR